MQSSGSFWKCTRDITQLTCCPSNSIVDLHTFFSFKLSQWISAQILLKAICILVAGCTVDFIVDFGGSLKTHPCMVPVYSYKCSTWISQCIAKKLEVLPQSTPVFVAETFNIAQLAGTNKWLNKVCIVSVPSKFLTSILIISLADVATFSDASGSWGCGAYSGQSWFQLAWTPKTTEYQIAVKELIPVVIAAAVWGKQWKGLDVKCYSDNQAVVAVVQSRTSRDSDIMHLLRCLSFIEARFEFCMSADYIPGKCNDLADDLSRNHLSSFLQKAVNASPQPTAIPQPLRDLLMVEKPDWLS